MNKYEFLKELKDALDGQVPYSEVESSCQYYREYIEEQIANGKSQEEVLEELGSPRLIARSIIDTKGGSKLHYDDVYEQEEEERREDTQGRVYTINSWVARLGCLFAVIITLVIVGSVAAVLLKFLGPIIIVLLGVYIVMNIFGRR